MNQVEEFISDLNWDKYLNIAKKLTGNTEDAEDLLQESILKALKYRYSYHDSNLFGWFYTIMRNNFINHYRHNKRIGQHIEFDLSLHAGSTKINIANLDLLENIEKENFKDFDIIKKWSEGFKYKELADIYSVNINTIKSRLHSVRRRISEIYEYY